LILEKLALSNNIRLAAYPGMIILRSIFRNCILSYFKLTFVLVLLLLANFGCKGRKSASPTPDIQINEKYWVRVLLLNNVEQCSIKVDSNFSIKDEANLQNNKSAKSDFNPLKESVIVKIVDGKINIADRNFSESQVIVLPDNPYVFSVNDKSYRGKVRFIENPDSNSFDVINIVPLESYIAGVAGAEMPDYWEPEALKCQVIAARTYCMFTKKRFGDKRTWDLNKTAANQVYLGMDAESRSVWKAVNETTGIVLTCKQADGKEDIFPAYYSSACGGHTEDSQNVFGDSYEPLKGVPCEYCKDVAKKEIFFWPDVEYEKADIISRLINRYPGLSRLEEIKEISVEEQSDYGEFSRMTRIKLTGSNGKSETLRAEDFRLTIDSTGSIIRSTTCKIKTTDTTFSFVDGRGWGHSVGMCQCGVQGMARQGKYAEEILSHYYPGSKYHKIDYTK